MSADDAMARLLAGLDRDERLARAASPGPWSVNDSDYPEYILDAGQNANISGGRWGGEARIFDCDEDALHIVRQGPDRTLRWVSVVRRMIAIRNGLAAVDHECEQCGGYRVEIALYDAIFADLASIYADEDAA